MLTGRPTRSPDRLRRRLLPPLIAAAAVAAGLAGALAQGCAGDGTTAGLYRRQCARCHGLDGTGNPRAVATEPGLDLVHSELSRHADRTEIRRRIVAGEGTMPAFRDKLTPEQTEAMVDHVLELAGRPPAPP